MASIEFIQKRIEGKEKEITKLEKKLARIQKAQATNWEVNPYYYGENDLRWTLRDLENARQSLEKYRADLQTETEKANSRNIAVIIEFLENWKKRVTEFYHNTFSEYPEAQEQYWEDMKQFPTYYGWRKLQKENPEEYIRLKNLKESIENAFQWKFGHILPYVERHYNRDTQKPEWTFDDAKTQKDLEQEANRKYDFIIDRTNAIVGTITDASNLEIGAKGDLNGFVFGTKGTAKVQTIGAGGYNIQCYHFRTLIHKVGA